MEPKGGLIAMSSDNIKDFSLRKWCLDNLLLMSTMGGVIFGGLTGFSLRSAVDLSNETILCISYPGEIFMRILKLIILPLIITSIISCCASLNATQNGKIAVRMFTYFVLTSFFNACLGVTLAAIIQPGQSAKTDLNNSSSFGSDNHPVEPIDAFLDIGRNVFPDNFFEAFFRQTHTMYVAEKSSESQKGNESMKFVRVLEKRNGTNNIGIIVVCLLFGTVLGTLETPSSLVVIDMFKTTYAVVMKIMTGVMWLTPMGISSVICGKILTVTDISVVASQLGWFLMTMVIGVLLYQLIVMQLIYLVFLRKNPFTFYWGLFPGMLTAFATASTAAALPVTFKCMDEKLNMNQKISRYVLTIGCSINMDGTALFLAVASMFIAQLNNFSIDGAGIATLILVCTAASMSSASVPSAALVLMLMVLSSVGCPIDDVSLLFAIDWLVDRCRTTNNMLGDCYASAVVEHLSRYELAEQRDHPQSEPLVENGQPKHAHINKSTTNGDAISTKL